MPAGYLFDMDGLLLDTEQLALDSFLDCSRDFCLDREDMRAFFMTLIGTSKAQGAQMLREFLGPDRDVEALELAWHEHGEARLQAGVPIKATVAETISRLHAEGRRMAVVTSTTGDRARHHLDRAGLLPWFCTVIGGDEVSANKPDPAPYRQAAEHLGCEAADCAAFEDSDPGITAATRAGCFAVQIPDLRSATQPFPDLGQAFAPTLHAAVGLAQRHFRSARGACAPAGVT